MISKYEILNFFDKIEDEDLPDYFQELFYSIISYLEEEYDVMFPYLQFPFEAFTIEEFDNLLTILQKNVPKIYKNEFYDYVLEMLEFFYEDDEFYSFKKNKKIRQTLPAKNNCPMR